MALYPPFVPDSYLQGLKYISPAMYSVKRISPIAKKHMDHHRLKKRNLNIRKKIGEEGKGIFFDQYS
jgi:hypothetical protein